MKGIVVFVIGVLVSFAALVVHRPQAKDSAAVHASVNQSFSPPTVRAFVRLADEEVDGYAFPFDLVRTSSQMPEETPVGALDSIRSSQDDRIEVAKADPGLGRTRSDIVEQPNGSTPSIGSGFMISMPAAGSEAAVLSAATIIIEEGGAGGAVDLDFEESEIRSYTSETFGSNQTLYPYFTSTASNSVAVIQIPGLISCLDGLEGEDTLVIESATLSLHAGGSASGGAEVRRLLHAWTESGVNRDFTGAGTGWANVTFSPTPGNGDVGNKVGNLIGGYVGSWNHENAFNITALVQEAFAEGVDHGFAIISESSDGISFGAADHSYLGKPSLTITYRVEVASTPETVTFEEGGNGEGVVDLDFEESEIRSYTSDTFGSNLTLYPYRASASSNSVGVLQIPGLLDYLLGVAGSETLTIDYAALRVYAGGDGSGNVDVRRLLRPWTELGVSRDATGVEPGWTNGAFSPTPGDGDVGTTLGSSSPFNGSWNSENLLDVTALVQEAVDEGIDHGFAIISDNADGISFGAADNPNLGRPSLEITYRIGTGGGPSGCEANAGDCSADPVSGVTICRIKALDGLTDLSPHQQSGDYYAFSSSGNWLVLREWGPDLDGVNLQLLNLCTGERVALGLTITTEFMWAGTRTDVEGRPVDDQFWLINSGQLVLREAAAPTVDIISHTLPDSIPGPGNGSAVDISWLHGTSSGESQLFLTAYCSIDDQGHHYYQMFDSQTGFPINEGSWTWSGLTGFWVADVMSNGVTKGHNPVSFDGGMLFSDNALFYWSVRDWNVSQPGPAIQMDDVWMKPDGSPYSPWNHITGELGSGIVAYGVGELTDSHGQSFHGIEIRNMDAYPSHDLIDHSPGPNLLQIRGNDAEWELENPADRGETLHDILDVQDPTDYVQFDHGTMLGDTLVWSASSAFDSRMWIVVTVFDFNAGETRSGVVTEFDFELPPGAASFWRNVAPSLSPDGRRIAWTRSVDETPHGRLDTYYAEISDFANDLREQLQE